MKKDASHKGYSGIGRSLRLLAAAACLWPAIAQAGQTWNPTATDAVANTAAGTGALNQHTAGGEENIAFGYAALYHNTTGSDNTASGTYALYANTTGSDNTASGANALWFNTTGSANVAVGYYALYSNTTASYNTATGRYALWNNTTGEINTASGANALYSNTTGKQNTAIGAQALGSSAKGSNNVAVGYGALQDLTGLSNNNIALGTGAGKNVKAGSTNIYIGHAGPAANESKTTRIGQAQTRTFIAGIKGVPLSGATVVVNAAGQLGVVASSARYKMKIESLGDVSDKLARLRPVSYRYKAEPAAMHYGLIAEEVDKVMPELVVRDDQDRPESVQYLEIVPLLLKQRQADRAELTRQRELNERQSGELARQIALNERQQSRLDRLQAALDRQAAELIELRRALDTRLAALDGGSTRDQK